MTSCLVIGDEGWHTRCVMKHVRSVVMRYAGIRAPILRDIKRCLSGCDLTNPEVAAERVRLLIEGEHRHSLLRFSGRGYSVVGKRSVSEPPPHGVPDDSDLEVGYLIWIVDPKSSREGRQALCVVGPTK